MDAHTKKARRNTRNTEAYLARKRVTVPQKKVEIGFIIRIKTYEKNNGGVQKTGKTGTIIQIVEGEEVVLKVFENEPTGKSLSHKLRSFQIGSRTVVPAGERLNKYGDTPLPVW
jgi:hypothetical protein